MESLDGILAQTLFHDPSKPSRGSASGAPFFIGRLTSGQTVKGEMRSPKVGETYRFLGEWKVGRSAKYKDPAFEFTYYEVIVDNSITGVVHYLKNYVSSLGLVKATALVEHFGAETLATLREAPEKAAQVHGITAANIEAIT